MQRKKFNTFGKLVTGCFAFLTMNPRHFSPWFMAGGGVGGVVAAVETWSWCVEDRRDRTDLSWGTQRGPVTVVRIHWHGHDFISVTDITSHQHTGMTKCKITNV